jgi:hypothetical protein
MKLSHSGTPIFSPAAAVVAGGAVVVAALFAFAVVALLFVFAVLEHPIRTIMQTTPSNKEILVNM